MSNCPCPLAAAGREARMTVVERKPDGTPSVWCDPCIVPLIAALNHAGIPTVASCCGHKEKPGWIALKDGRQLIIYDTLEQAHAAYPKPPAQSEREAYLLNLCRARGSQMTNKEILAEADQVFSPEPPR